VRLNYIHVLVTPDIAGCHSLQTRPERAFRVVRCLHDDEVFRGSPSIADIRALLWAKGPHSRSKGPFWYFQQYLKIGAVALGAGGLGERVRISDGETITLRNPSSWFDAARGVVYRDCGEKGDGHNGDRYGALYYRATGSTLFGSSSVVSHGQSVSRTFARSLVDALSPETGNNVTNAWVLYSLGLLCDQAAITGFSEYWYLFSHAVERFPANVTWAAGQACHRIKKTGKLWLNMSKCSLASYDNFTHVDYVILEDHKSRRADRQ